MKGQGATEYLVIMAVVLIVALVVIGLLGWFPGIAGGTQEQQSATYWQSATPLSIKAFKVYDYNFDINNQHRASLNFDLTMTNTLSEPITLTSISIDGKDLGIENTTFNAGESKLVRGGALEPPSCGDAGTSFEYKSIEFTYNRGGLTGIKEVGKKSLIGACSAPESNVIVGGGGNITPAP